MKKKLIIKNNDIKISAKTLYMPRESDPMTSRYVFTYFINIQNNSLNSVQLLRRQWLITDANGNVQKVAGEGVVGEQPHIQPGEFYEYNSFAIIKTPIGSMQGSYQFENAEGQLFDAPIPVFSLAIPRILN